MSLNFHDISILPFSSPGSRTTSSAACSAALQAQPKGPAAAMAAATANDRKEEGEKSSAPRGVVGKKRWYPLVMSK